MKKLVYFISAIIALAVVSIGCSGDSYQKKLDNEKKAIKRALADYEILYTYPSNHKFDKDQYYLEGSTGVYLQVVDPGDLDNLPKKEEKQRIYMRFDSVHSMVADVWYAGNKNLGGIPVVFEYGVTDTYSGGKNGTTTETTYMSPACVLPLEKGLGNNAIVNLIVPFVNGSSYQSQSYVPFHYIGVQYTFNRQTED